MGKIGSRAHGNRKSRVLGWETADQWKKGIAGSRWVETADQWKKGIAGSRWVETADQWKKGIAGSRWVKTADQSEKRIVGSRWVKTAEKTRAQSPKSNLGKRGWSFENNTNKKNKFLLICFLQERFPECSLMFTECSSLIVFLL